MKCIEEKLKNSILILDGAMGDNDSARGFNC